MKCPRCQSLVSAAPDASGLVVCPSCGARLRSKAASAASKTLPPGTPLPEFARPGGIESTLVTARKLAARATGSAEAPAAPADAGGPALERILASLEALRQGQEEILDLLRGRPSHASAEPLFQEPAIHASAEGDRDDAAPRPPPVVRSRRRKTVLVVDDDAAERAEVVAALEKAEVPVRAVGDGNASLASIAQDKPDVIVLELALGGSMGGRDVVNMIKATMEWIDIPIVLYTRLPIESQKEARQIHGADDLVRKGPGAPDTLVSRVISLFRRA